MSLIAIVVMDCTNKNYSKQGKELMSSVVSAMSTNSQALQQRKEAFPISSKRQGNFDLPAMMYPNPQDVLFGRGRPYQLHEGNLRMKEIVARHKKEYQDTPRHLKQRITRRVIREIRDTTAATPVRFMREIKEAGMDPMWKDASEEEIFEKISHCLRNRAIGNASNEESWWKKGASLKKKKQTVPRILPLPFENIQILSIDQNSSTEQSWMSKQKQTSSSEHAVDEALIPSISMTRSASFSSIETIDGLTFADPGVDPVEETVFDSNDKSGTGIRPGWFP